MRLVDADNARECFGGDGVTGAVMQRMFDSLPTIDAVPVVRCRECKFYREFRTKRHNQLMRLCYRMGKHDMEYPVKPDDMVIVNPQVEHTELSLNASPLEYIVLGVAGIEILFGKADSSYAIFNCRENRERMVTLLHMLLAEADRSLDGCETVCQDLLEVLLIWLVRCTTLSLQVEETPRSDSRECVEIKRYLDSNFREDISLDRLAEIAHINKYYLAHTFQKEYGISPITYLNRRRIEESKYMLGNTGYSLAQISELMGFSSPSYFSQCFRKAEGLTPNEYRRQVRQGQRPAPAKRHER